MTTPLAPHREPIGPHAGPGTYPVVPAHVQSFRDEMADGALRAAKVTLGTGAVVAAMWAFSNLLTPGAAPVVTTPLVGSTQNVTRTAGGQSVGADPKVRDPRLKDATTVGGIRGKIAKAKKDRLDGLKKNQQQLNRKLANAQNEQQRTRAIRAYWADNDRVIKQSEAATQKAINAARKTWNETRPEGHSVRRGHARIQADVTRASKSIERRLARVKQRERSGYLSSKAAERAVGQLATESRKLGLQTGERYDKNPYAKSQLVKAHEAQATATKQLRGKRSMDRMLKRLGKGKVTPGLSQQPPAGVKLGGSNALERLEEKIAGTRREDKRARTAKARAQGELAAARANLKGFGDRNSGARIAAERRVAAAQKAVGKADRRIEGAHNRILNASKSTIKQAGREQVRVTKRAKKLRVSIDGARAADRKAREQKKQAQRELRKSGGSSSAAQAAAARTIKRADRVINRSHKKIVKNQKAYNKVNQRSKAIAKKSERAVKTVKRNT